MGPDLWENGHTTGKAGGSAMETIYYHLNTTRVTRGGNRKVAGGEEVHCVVLPKKARPAPPEGKVLDFAAYRRALEPVSAPPAETPQPEQARPASGRRPSLWLLAEVGASAAVVLCTALTALVVLLG